VGLERDPLNLVRIIEELLDEKVVAWFRKLTKCQGDTSH
jgi:hypothetical protein